MPREAKPYQERGWFVSRPHGEYVRLCKVEEGMKIKTDTERVRHSRRLVLELLASSVDMSLTSGQVHGWMDRYGAEPSRFGAGGKDDGVGDISR